MTKPTTDCFNEYVIRSRFRKMGNMCTDDIRIELSADKAMTGAKCFLAGQSFMEGAYSFNKEALKMLDGMKVFRDRDQLSCYPFRKLPKVLGTKAQKDAFIKGTEFGRMVNYARTLGNLPSNIFGIDEFVEYISRLSDDLKIKCKIMRDAELRNGNCGGILAVNRGSGKEAAMAVLSFGGYRTGGNTRRTALVGKGVMYDTGGNVLKDMKNMYGMKFDMCGAATVLEVAEYVRRFGQKCDLTVVLPIVENVVGPEAIRPGDVVQTHSGRTVEIMNTDAEGRLILCDAISMAADEGAEEIITLATLTNSCREALGDHVTGVFSNDDEAYERFSRAASCSAEKIWRLPLDYIYTREVEKSQVADLINYAPGNGAGASIAAGFLECFIPGDVKWIHLDCVGPAVRKNPTEHGAAGATGVMAGSILRTIED